MIDSSILLKASRSWLVYNSYSSFLPLYLEIGTMFTFFPVFWCLTCPPRALKEKCLYFWDGAYKYVLRISLNMADLKTFNLTKLVLSVPEGGNGMLSSGDLWTSLHSLLLPVLSILHPFHSFTCRFSCPNWHIPLSSPALCHCSKTSSQGLWNTSCKIQGTLCGFKLSASLWKTYL